MIVESRTPWLMRCVIYIGNATKTSALTSAVAKQHRLRRRPKGREEVDASASYDAFNRVSFIVPIPSFSRNAFLSKKFTLIRRSEYSGSRDASFSDDRDASSEFALRREGFDRIPELEVSQIPINFKVLKVPQPPSDTERRETRDETTRRRENAVAGSLIAQARFFYHRRLHNLRISRTFIDGSTFGKRFGTPPCRYTPIIRLPPSSF